jgi:hypothetical protein
MAAVLAGGRPESGSGTHWLQKPLVNALIIADVIWNAM